VDDVTLILGDALTELAKLPTASVDAVVTDPPYGILPGAWDKAPDVAACVQEVQRVLKPTGFFAFFGQMPSMLPWIVRCQNSMTFYEHVVWVKRNTLPGGNEYRLSRSHESILIYAASPGNRAHSIKGPFEDVKVPGLLYDIATVEGIARNIADLRLWIERGKPRTRSFSPTSGRKEFHRIRQNTTFDTRVNFTNVWSFLPPALRKKGDERHPTEKPVPVVERLCEMTAPDGGIIVDPFMGSGTAAVACIRTGRRFIGIEIVAEYVELARERIGRAQLQPPLITPPSNQGFHLTAAPVGLWDAEPESGAAAGEP
jgi:site-specific DNA-methyltransferase (adenine-specific)